MAVDVNAILDGLQESITKSGGILDEIYAITTSTGSEDDKKAAAFKLTGAVFSMIIDIIKACLK